MTAPENIGVNVPAISDRFIVISEVGRGGYGVVYKAIDTMSGDIVALKQVNSFNVHVGLPLSFYRENASLTEMKDNPNIVNLRETVRSEDGEHLYMVLDYCEYDLSGLLHSYTLNGRQIQSYMKQILLAVKSLHDKGFVHRDLKPSNIFLTKNNVIKVGDFGLTRKIDKKRTLTPKVMTRSYRPPEVILGDSHYNSSVDIWSLGCVFFEMLTGKALFKPTTSSDFSLLDSIFAICGSPNDENWPGFNKLPNAGLVQISKPNTNKSTLREFLQENIPIHYQILIELLEKMLKIDPNQRITVDQALEHPFFESNFVLRPLKYPEVHGSVSSKEKIPIKKNILDLKKLIRSQRVMPPPILA